MSDEISDTFAQGAAPGDTTKDAHGPLRETINYLIGLSLATFLTILSFWVASEPSILYTPGTPMALAALAIAQMGVHLAFFLHMTTGPDNLNNALALAFGVLIVGLVIGGTVWIMYHLDMNMMSHGGMQHMGM